MHLPVPHEDDVITIDGEKGEVLIGRVATIDPELSRDFAEFMSWADERKRLKVLTNADIPKDCRKALEYGAEGIGLYRTEHTFFEPGRIAAVREMILAENGEDQRAALNKVLPMQRGDFVDICRIMAGRPVTIRLLDPPLHELLPRREAELTEVAKTANLEVGKLRDRVAKILEVNPMLGHCGCRVDVTTPGIYEMQTRAILEAPIEVAKADERRVRVEIMVKFVAMEAELRVVRGLIEGVAKELLAGEEDHVEYRVGTMIELPRAPVAEGKIARQAEFFSFGTNDLTQTTLGLSRDDAAGFLPSYEAGGLLEKDPFVSIDGEGVGELVRMAAQPSLRRRHDNPECRYPLLQ